MDQLHQAQQKLLSLISIEMKEQERKFSLSGSTGLKQLKSEGLALHPITVLKKSFGFADYPEVRFKLPYYNETINFKENSSIECFFEDESPVKGLFLGFEGNVGVFRLITSDFPDWIEDKGVGIKLSPDYRTYESMIEAVKNVSEKIELKEIFHQVHGDTAFSQGISLCKDLNLINLNLNESQISAVQSIVSNSSLLVVHGPPGTGKTTTLIEGIVQLVREGNRILVSAPSNTAVDHIAKGLLAVGVKILRVGNTLKVDEDIFKYTPEGRIQDSKEAKDIKKMKIRSEEYRRMMHQYKRSFGKAERDQRNLLFKEVKSIQKEIRAIRNYFNEKIQDEAEVLLGTPIGLTDFLPKNAEFDTLIFDESGQALEPLAWLIMPFARRWVFAGDHFQLPPTVLSQEAISKGFAISILESVIQRCEDVCFLNTQYRMKKSIADFSSNYFYGSKLLTPPKLQDDASNVLFFDTAGTGYEEETGKDGNSLLNHGELLICKKIIEQEQLTMQEIAFISPYQGQVQLAKETLPKEILIRTIDSFQGQEKEIIILSLVRSNQEGIIGFLKDYRRMNVALTRAKEKLFVIGDSSTIGMDSFYASFLAYIEEIGGYRSVWELDLNS